MGKTISQFLVRAAIRQRVILTGGLAVIAHGFNRPTKDGDAWLDPLTSPGAWAGRLRETLREFTDLRLWSLAMRRDLAPDELEESAEIDGVIRVRGLDRDLDLFYRPTGIACEAFDDVWSRAKVWEGEVRVMEPLDLLLTKEGTGREQDQKDVFHLESVIRRDFGARLAVCTLADARALFERYADHVVAARALTNPDPAVQSLAREILAELAEAGDPFARDLLAGRQPPE